MSENQSSGAAAFASVHTTNFPEILRQLRASLFLTTYQAGRLVIVRPDGEVLNTHLTAFERPMGLVVDDARLFVGARSSIHELRNVPFLAQRLGDDPPRDAAYVPRNMHVTGAIDIHEMAWGNGGLVFVNTAFSCLCRMENEYSFTPFWRPSFISAYAHEDRCHLNGLAMVEGEPRYCTALGQTNAPRGWRDNKRDGGILIDVDSDEVIASGLSMPHSPRWYRDQLWLLESGTGALVTIDPANGQKQTIAQVPGFARGLDFAGPLAFIGLSKLRETNAFTDIPITDDNRDRQSGVWAVNIETGQTVAFLKFSDFVQEIFAVHVNFYATYPETVDYDSEMIRSTFVLPDGAMKEVQTPAHQGAWD